MAKKAYIGVPSFEPVELPSGYTQVEYIQSSSSGGQYINTRFSPDSNTRIVCTVYGFDTSKGSQFVFGSRISSSSNAFTLLCTDNQAYRSDFGANQATFSTSVNISGMLTIDKNKTTTTLNGNDNVNNTAQSFTSPLNIYLLACNTNGAAGNYAVNIKLYSCKIFNNGTLVRNFIPCKNSNGTVGMYDLVNSTFYTNAGTGVFTAGASTITEKARQIKKIYTGVNNIARKVKKGYIGVGGIARLFFNSAELSYYGRLTSLSRARCKIATAAIGNYYIWAGGESSTTAQSNVDCYTTSLTKGSISSLTLSESDLAGTNVGNYALFGLVQTENVFTYSSSLTRGVKSVSTAREYVGAASTANHALFAGGIDYSDIEYSTVDAFNTSLTLSTAPTLVSSRHYITGASFNGYAFFIGGIYSAGSPRGSLRSTVDCYSISLTRVSVSSMPYVTAFNAVATTNTHLLISGGRNDNSSSNSASNQTTAFNSSLTRISAPVMASAKQTHAGAGLSDYAVFAGGNIHASLQSNPIDIYDTSLVHTTMTNNLWACEYFSGLGYKNKAIFAGGKIDSSWNGSSTSNVAAFILE